MNTPNEAQVGYGKVAFEPSSDQACCNTSIQEEGSSLFSGFLDDWFGQSANGF